MSGNERPCPDWCDQPHPDGERLPVHVGGHFLERSHPVDLYLFKTKHTQGTEMLIRSRAEAGTDPLTIRTRAEAATLAALMEAVSAGEVATAVREAAELLTEETP